MISSRLNYFLSIPRFETYLAKTYNNFEESCQLYKMNIELSETFYPVLSILEISLRNAINEQLTIHFNDHFWFKNYLPDEFSLLIANTIRKIENQHRTATADRIISELSFEFWNRLFNRHHTALLWKPLRTIFSNMPKYLRQREVVADILYRTRTLRNRIYHYEPIPGNLQIIETQYNEMILFLTWLDSDLPDLLTDIDRFKDIIEKARR